ncbi:hypothetical protein LSTR_LSTR015336 [Laodelphax striatellus]|uniref:Transposase domain-containing protein n=1 Tax=Laodelphax striatellus TaxID=195883 RepID=A0A482WV26_LAOST|nr:hypothetical protein LSTR_LSTR015336 [Laodelphax striatellus]
MSTGKMKRRKNLGIFSERHLRRLANLETQNIVNDLQPSLLNPDEDSAVENSRNQNDPSTSHNSSTGIQSLPGCSTESSIPDFLSDFECEERILSSCSNSDSETYNLPDLPSQTVDTVEKSFGTELASWAVSNRINHSSLTSLLKLLKINGHPDLPSDARTLLGTPRNTSIREVCPGEYWHYGIENALIRNLNDINLENLVHIELSINIDGLPISRSSGSSLWPILGSITHLNSVFLIGVYHGASKPENANDFLEEFVAEAQQLLQSGVIIGQKKLHVILKCLIFDAPAKSFILNVKGHSGYSSCTKCLVEGESIENRMCFNDLDAPKRTDADFISKTDEEYHLGETVLTSIENLGLVTNVPLDYMHLVCLGVVRKMMYMWIGGSFKTKLSSRQINLISERLQNIQEWMAKDFVRKPRSLSFLRQWKATEFRQFLLYSGPIILERLLPRHMFHHFLTLSVAIRILCSPNVDETYIDYAGQLLRHFVLSFKDIYGYHFVTHNVHGLIHLTDDVKKFGALDNFSAFKYENYLQTLKKLIRKADKPLQQICRRHTELEKNCIKQRKDSDYTGPTGSGLHYDGPLTENSMSPQYKKLIFQNVSLDTNNKGDGCCILKDNTVVLVKNIAHAVNSQELVVIGYDFKTITNSFEKPCKSSILNIYKVCHLSTNLKQWSAASIHKKCVLIPLENEAFSILPLLHSESHERTML